MIRMRDRALTVSSRTGGPAAFEGKRYPASVHIQFAMSAPAREEVAFAWRRSERGPNSDNAPGRLAVTACHSQCADRLMMGEIQTQRADSLAPTRRGR